MQHKSNKSNTLPINQQNQNKTKNELSIFVDESGSQGGHSDYILVTFIFHNQSEPINQLCDLYESDLRFKSLPNIPFHMSPLMNAHKDYENLSPEQRKKLLFAFEAFVRKLPVTYKTFIYKRNEVQSPQHFTAIFKRDLAMFLSAHLDFFQKYDAIKIYYDNGQKMITNALHEAIDYMLSTHAPLYKMSNAKQYRLSQVADYVCALELTNIKFKTKHITKTDSKFFGTNYRKFKVNHLNKIRRKQMV